MSQHDVLNLHELLFELGDAGEQRGERQKESFPVWWCCCCCRECSRRTGAAAAAAAASLFPPKITAAATSSGFPSSYDEIESTSRQKSPAILTKPEGRPALAKSLAQRGAAARAREGDEGDWARAALPPPLSRRSFHRQARTAGLRVRVDGEAGGA